VDNSQKIMVAFVEYVLIIAFFAYLYIWKEKNERSEVMYQTRNLYEVAFLKLKGFTPKSSQKRGMKVYFEFEESKELQEAVREFMNKLDPLLDEVIKTRVEIFREYGIRSGK